MLRPSVLPLQGYLVGRYHSIRVKAGVKEHLGLEGMDSCWVAVGQLVPWVGRWALLFCNPQAGDVVLGGVALHGGPCPLWDGL